MIDVFLIHYHGCARPTFTPRQAIYAGGPSPERVEDIKRRFPAFESWIWRRDPATGAFMKWQFRGTY